jgi:hypothetical protein
VRDDPLNYDRLMEDALRGVVRQALAVAGERGLPGQHHFYITFRTDLAGVDIPDSLRRRYPKEMTIVLQHQFWGLEIVAERFEVTLSFDSKHERLVIPFAAVTAFVDPSVQFGLQFPSASAAEPAVEAAPGPTPLPTPDAARERRGEVAAAKLGPRAEARPAEARPAAAKPGDDKPADGKADAKGAEPKAGDAKPGEGRVVALDAFRNKK